MLVFNIAVQKMYSEHILLIYILIYSHKKILKAQIIDLGQRYHNNNNKIKRMTVTIDVHVYSIIWVTSCKFILFCLFFIFFCTVEVFDKEVGREKRSRPADFVDPSADIQLLLALEQANLEAREEEFLNEST